MNNQEGAKIGVRDARVRLPIVLLGLSMIPLGLYVPGQTEEPLRSYPEGGWLETELPDRDELINPTSGHKEFLRYMCMNSPVLRNAVAKGFGYLVGQNEGERSLLGDVLERFIEDAGQAIEDIKGGVPTLADQIHVATYALAAVYSNFFAAGEARGIFKAQIDERISDNDEFFLDQMPQHVPIIFEGDDGVDKMMHVANHAFLAHMLLYAKRWRLQDWNRIPLAASALQAIQIGDAAQIAAIRESGGIAWEIVEGFEWLFEGLGNGEDPNGIVARDVTGDYRANRIGTGIALALPIESPIQEDVDRLRVVLNREPENIVAS